MQLSALPFGHAALVFLATAVVDFCWTKYIATAAAKRPHPAAAWSASIILLGAFSVVAYTENHWMLIPAAAGAYVGTYLAVLREKRKDERASTCPPCDTASGH